MKTFKEKGYTIKIWEQTPEMDYEDRNFDDEILIECRFNERFKKWEPVSLSEGPIDSV